MIAERSFWQTTQFNQAWRAGFFFKRPARFLFQGPGFRRKDEKMGTDMDRIYEMENGEKAYFPFSAAEMDGRQARLRKLMEAKRIDACLFTSYHNICYFSGFLYCSFGRKYGFLVTETLATTISAGIGRRPTLAQNPRYCPHLYGLAPGQLFLSQSSPC